MNPVISIAIPGKADKEFWHSIIDSIRSDKFNSASIQFDWSACTQIDDISLCLLLNIIVECESRKIRIFNAPLNPDSFYQIKVYPLISFPINNLDTNEIKSHAFVTAVNDDEKALARVELMKKFLGNHELLRNVDTSALEIIFAELYMNVCQHSSLAEIENGMVLISVDESHGLLEMVVSDIGVGIPANIKEAFEAFEDECDAKAIAYATEDMVTTRNTEQNYGRGLNTLKTSVVSLNGELDIFSGNGHFSIRSGNENHMELSCYHNGTQIRLLFDLSNFEMRSKSDFSEEVNF